jgi:uncharacterized protein (DUF736 family)
MSIIGSFTKNANGFSGAIKTLCLDVQAKFVPVPKDSDKAPDFRILVGNIEFGAGWKKSAQNGHAYISVRLDDPSFSNSIFANLVEAEGSSYILVWSRRKSD